MVELSIPDSHEVGGADEERDAYCEPDSLSAAAWTERFHVSLHDSRSTA